MHGGYRRAMSLYSSVKTTQDETARSDIEQLQRKVGQQNLIIQTLIAILLEKGVFTEDEFHEIIEEIDELDGKKDGALAEDKSPVTCKACGKNNSRTKDKCMWCGKALEKADLIVRMPE